METFTKKVDTVVKSAYRRVFSPIIRRFGLEYQLKKLYSLLMAIFIDTTTISANNISCEIVVSMREYLIFRLADLGGERSVVTEFLNTIHSDDLVYDIGAFVGMYSLFAAKSGADVVAFEPNSNNHNRLMENIKLNNISNIKTYPIALGSETEKVRIQSNSIFDHRSQITRDGKGDVVQCLRGEEFINTNDVVAPDVMKIDVEGAERDVLDGFGSTLSSCRAIFCEVHTEIVDVDKITADLEEHGFTTEIIHERTNEVFIKAVK